MVESFPFVVAVPMVLCRQKEIACAEDIRTDESKRVGDASIDMTLCCQVYHSIGIVTVEQGIYCLFIGNIGPFEDVVGVVVYVFQVLQVTCISEYIDVDDLIVGVSLEQSPNDMRANKSGTSSYEYSLHFSCEMIFIAAKIVFFL